MNFKERISIVEKIQVVGEILELATDETGEMSYVGFEIGKVYYIARAYCMNFSELEVSMDDTASIIATYENIMESKIWNELCKKEDVQLLIEIAKKRYDEVFFMQQNISSKVVAMLEEMIDSIPNKDTVASLIQSSRNYMNNTKSGD